MTVLITHAYSDPHFGHAAIISHASRPFRDADEMDAELERRYRAVVSATDVVLWVGDVSFRDRLWTRALLERLPGRKLLVRGNHDGTVGACLDLGFDVVCDFMHLRIAGHKVTVSHYPPTGATADARYPERRPPNPQRGEFVLHGHTHEKARRVGRRLHVGVDAWGFAPATLSEIEALIVGNVDVGCATSDGERG